MRLVVANLDALGRRAPAALDEEQSQGSVNILIPLQTTSPGSIRYGTLIPSNVREGGRGGRCSDDGAQQHEAHSANLPSERHRTKAPWFVPRQRRCEQ